MWWRIGGGDGDNVAVAVIGYNVVAAVDVNDVAVACRAGKGGSAGCGGG
jgi:hypothetical protein